MELAYEVTLKAENNLGKIEDNTLVAADFLETDYIFLH